MERHIARRLRRQQTDDDANRTQQINHHAVDLIIRDILRVKLPRMVIGCNHNDIGLRGIRLLLLGISLLGRPFLLGKAGATERAEHRIVVEPITALWTVFHTIIPPEIYFVMPCQAGPQLHKMCTVSGWRIYDLDFTMIDTADPPCILQTFADGDRHGLLISAVYLDRCPRRGHCTGTCKVYHHKFIHTV